MNILPAILGVVAFVVLIFLLVQDYNKNKIRPTQLNVEQDSSASKRLSKTIKGFLLIICLVIILGTVMFYWG